MFVVVLVSLLLVAVPKSVGAEVLPVVLDETAGGAAWWAEERPAPAGSFDEALFTHAGAGSDAWLSPMRATPTGTVSRVLRRADITANNARSLAGLYGASEVLLGRVFVVDEGEVPWLGLRYGSVAFEGALLDVASGATLRVLSLVRTGYGGASPRDVASAQLADAVVQIGGALSRSVQHEDAAQPGEIVVRSRGGALPFVALRGAIRESHPSVVDLTEVWATEGEIGLAVILDEGAGFDDVARSVSRLEGTELEGARVTRVEVHSGVVWIDVSAVPTGASRETGTR